MISKSKVLKDVNELIAFSRKCRSHATTANAMALRVKLLRLLGPKRQATPKKQSRKKK